MPVWPLGLYALFVVTLLVLMVLLPQLLAERHREPATGEPYESGIAATGSARVRVSAHYYLVAMLFVIFDVEAVFLFAWAVAARQLGWPGYLEAALFVGVLLLALVYLWRAGALAWGTQVGARRLPSHMRQLP